MNRLTKIISIATCSLSLLAAMPAQSALIAGELGVLDVAANGGINPATGAAWAVGDTYRLTFITSDTFTATSTDINDYNTFVQGVANSSTLDLGSATWKVIGATDSVDARTNTGTPTSSPGEATFLMDGSTVFATSYTDLWNGTAAESPGLFAAPDLDENGDFLTENRVFTGTNSGLNTAFRQLGDPSGVTETGTNQPNNSGRWLIQFNSGQNSPNSFYALSDPLSIVAIPEPSNTLLLGFAALGLLARRRR